MHKLPKDGTAVWTNTIWKGKKQSVLESLYTFVAISLLGWLNNTSPVFNKTNPSLTYHKQIKSIQIQWGSSSIFQGQFQYV